MDCSLPGSSVDEVTRVGHDLATKPPLPPPITELVAPTSKNLPAMQEIHVLSLSREDPLEKEMASHSSLLDWRIPWTEDPSRLQSMGLQRVDTAEPLSHTQS